jgi:hypothetical protein
MSLIEASEVAIEQKLVLIPASELGALQDISESKLHAYHHDYR